MSRLCFFMRVHFPTGLRSALERHLIGLPRLNVCRSCDNCCRTTDDNTFSTSIRGSHWARVSLSIGMFDHIVLLRVMPLLDITQLQCLPACSRLFLLMCLRESRPLDGLPNCSCVPAFPGTIPIACHVIAIAIYVSIVSS